MSSYRRLGEALKEAKPVSAEDYFWDSQEHFYWGAALMLLTEAKEAAGGSEIQNLSEIVERLVRFIRNHYPSSGSGNDRRKKARILIRRMKWDDPGVYPRHEYAFLARELLRIALVQIAQPKQR